MSAKKLFSVWHLGVFLTLLISTSFVHTKKASLWGQKLFPDDIITERQNVQNVKIQLDSQKKAKNPDVVIVDVKGNPLDSEMDRQEGQSLRNLETQIDNKVARNFEAVTIRIFEDSDNEMDTKVYNNELQTESVLKVKETADNDTNEIPPAADDSENKAYKVCGTVKCKKLAKEFQKSMNRSVNPCENFYEFACGAWPATNPIPPYMASWDRLEIAERLGKHRIKDYKMTIIKMISTTLEPAEILETKPKPSDILPVRQAKKWYRSCMNTGKLERRGLKPIDSIMMQVGGWPMAMDKEEWHEAEYSWQRVERHYARLTGSYVFYDIYPNYVQGDDDFGNININAPELPLANKIKPSFRDYSKNRYKQYRLLIQKMARVFMEHNKASVSNASLLRESRELVLFERAIFKLSRNKSDGFYVSFDEISDWYYSDDTESRLGDPETGIDWRSAIQGMFDTVNIEVNPSTQIYIQNEAYVKGIGKLLDRTPSRTIVNYIHWHFLVKTLAFTTEKMRNEFFQRIYQNPLGIKERKPRWLECVEEMKMREAAAYAYVMKYFPDRSKSHEMIGNIRGALEEKIHNSNWLDEKSKALTEEKLKKMQFFVGFPDWYYNKTEIINYYKGITIGADYFDNSLSYMRYEMKLKLKRYESRPQGFVPFSHESHSPLSANAVYIYSYNFAVFPAVNFDSHFFGTDLPNNVNYGIAGFFIGHEMSHGFDRCGINYDKDGDGTKLTDIALRSYYERVECFIDQFDKYHGNKKPENATAWNCDKVKQDGNKTAGQITAAENIADSTGLQSIFQAYKKFSKKKNPNGEIRLPGLEEFTDNQLFFLSFAEMWCHVETPLFTKIRALLNDEHSRAEHRVIGAISNTKDFAKAFNCPAGSSMNPSNKCDIWDKPGAKVDRKDGKKNRHFW